MFFFAAFKPVLPCAGAEEAAVRDVPGSHRATEQPGLGSRLCEMRKQGEETSF